MANARLRILTSSREAARGSTPALDDNGWTDREIDLDVDGELRFDVVTPGQSLFVPAKGKGGVLEIKEVFSDSAPSVSLSNITVAPGGSVDVTPTYAGTNRTYSISGPAWLSIDSSGEITGTAPSADVTSTYTVTVSNAHGSVSDTAAVNVSEVTETHVFLSLGQSNEGGRAPDPGGVSYPPQVQQYGKGPSNTYADSILKPAVEPLDWWNPNPGQMGGNRQFFIDYCAANPGVNVVVIPRAEGGSTFVSGDWQVGGRLYNEAVKAANDLLAANPTWLFKGILWHQGESDNGSAPNYQQRFFRTIDQMRADITGADESTPFICGEISTGSPGYNATINDAIKAVPNFFRASACVDLQDAELAVGDLIHFSPIGYNTKGARYQTALATAAANTMPAESGATAHWRFGFANRSYRDFVSGQTLTENETALTHALNYSTVVGQNDGLASSIQEQATMTACFVVYTGASSYPNTIIGGTLRTSANGSDGHSLYLSAGAGLILNERGGIGATTAIGLTLDSYVFVAVSLAASGEYIVYRGGDTSFARTGTGTRNASTRNYSIGDVHYNASPFVNTCRFASAIFFMGQAKTQLELDAIYAREKAALALRGLTIL